MKNIIKAQFYQMKKDKLIFIVFSIFMLCQILKAGIEMMVPLDKLTGCHYVATNFFDITIISVFFIFIITGYLCGNDFTDKTTNYEVMSGHIRKEVYLGRVIPCIIFGCISTVILTSIPIILVSAFNGWGDKISVWEIVFRIFLMMFPVARIMCELVFLTFVIKNPYITMALGYIIFMVSNMMPQKNYIISFSNFNMLNEIDVWQTYGLEGKGNLIFDASLSITDISATIILSLVFGGLALYLGYIFFKNDDLN